MSICEFNNATRVYNLLKIIYYLERNYYKKIKLKIIYQIRQINY